MQFDPIVHLKEMMRIRGVGVFVLTPTHDESVDIDDDLRFQLYGKFDLKRFVLSLLERCCTGTIYLASDKFDLNFIYMKVSAEELIFIGPYTLRPHEELFKTVCERIEIPAGRMSEIQSYFYSIPSIPSGDVFESEVIIIAKYIIGSEEHTVVRTVLPIHSEDRSSEISEFSDSRLSISVLESIYQNEDNYLDAVERGDLKQAMLFMSMFSKYRFASRHTDSLRNLKNYYFVLNTLLRKAVQRAAVHPAYIHQTSYDFAIKIEAALTESELSTKIVPSMVKKYCSLVNEHSLRNYTLPIRKAVNFIAFNYTDELTLEKVAETANVNYTYLSSQFKKETGSTVVDYISMKRMQKATALLSSTNLSVSTIAGKCGYTDDTYFTRVFKKKYGKSPREYRKSIHK